MTLFQNRSLLGHGASLLAGALLPLALAPFDLWPLGVLSCALLALLLGDLTAKQVFRRSLAYGLGLYGVGISWVYISIHTHGGESVAVSLFLTGLLVLVMALLFALPFALFGWVAGGRIKRLALFPALWVLVEWLRGWIFTGFPWLYLGNGFIDTWLAGWAPLTGVLGLSLIGAASGAALAELVRQRQSLLPKLLPVTAMALLWPSGLGLQGIQWTQPADKSLSLAMVQPALTPSQKWDENILYDILVQLRDQTSGHWDNDLVIWPESAIPAVRQDVAPFIDFLGELAKESDSLFITGIPLYEDGKYYNGVILLGNGEGSYRKRHLVPFGEYIPLDSVLRGVIAFFDRPMSSFSKGPDDQPLLHAGDTTIATAICYEIVFQDLVSSTAKDADLILTLSNDVWFGDSIAPHQHLQMARLRAIENAKPVVRSTNDGITAVIDAQGAITHQLPQFVPGTLEAEVLPHSGSTPFNRLGSWPVVAVCLAVMALGLWRRRTAVADGRLTADHPQPPHFPL